MKNLFLLLLIITAQLQARTVPSHVTSFIDDVLPLAIKLQEKYGVPITLTLAVSCYESGYGKSFNAKNRNNYFGIKSWSTESGWKEYKSIEESFDDFGRLLMKTKRYRALANYELTDMYNWTTELSALGYNREPTYAPFLRKLIRLWSLNKYQTEEIVAYQKLTVFTKSIDTEYMKYFSFSYYFELLFYQFATNVLFFV